MFRLIAHGNLKYFQIDEFSNTGLVKHCFSTKKGGISKGEFESMNLRFNCDDSQENVIENFRILCNDIGVDYRKLVLSKQVHEDNIFTAEKGDCGNGIVKPQNLTSADALITGESGVPLAVFSADCVPVFFLDKRNRVIALAHSGWKGTVKRISQKTVEKMRNDFHSHPEDIIAAIGPSIGVCHFEVGEDVADIFRAEFGDSVIEKHKKYHVNMQKAISQQLSESGITDKNIICSDICTFCNSDLFFSHRKTKGRRGVMAAVIELK